jgi:hypothetical protein
MITPGYTYHYVGPLNARRRLVPRLNPSLESDCKDQLPGYLLVQRQHGHFGLAGQD